MSEQEQKQPSKSGEEDKFEGGFDLYLGLTMQCLQS